jgi:hypothetical protein
MGRQDEVDGDLHEGLLAVDLSVGEQSRVSESVFEGEESGLEFWVELDAVGGEFGDVGGEGGVKLILLCHYYCREEDQKGSNQLAA